MSDEAPEESKLPDKPAPPVKRKRGNPNWVKGQRSPTAQTWPKGIQPPGSYQWKGNPVALKVYEYRKQLSKQMLAKFTAAHVVEVMEAWLEHVRDRHDPVKGFGWQKSADLFMDRLLGKPKVDAEPEDNQQNASRADLVIELRRTFGLTVTHEAEAKEAAIEGEIVQAQPALPAPADASTPSDLADRPVLPVPETVD